jgi:outer membrane receptor protein involved in Fe transport
VITAVLALSAALEGQTALSEEVGGPDLPAPLEQMQVTATRAERLVYDVAQAVTLVDSESIRRNSPQVLPEELRGRVGTFFQQTTPGQGTAIIRGLKGSQILHLVDGIRLNNAFFRSAPNQYLALVDPYAVAQMEVVRGSAGTLYGSDAMGGVVQVLTREPSFGTGQTRASADAYAAYSHADRGKVLRAETDAAWAGLGFTGGVTWQDYEDRRTGRGRIQDSDYDSRAADAKLGLALGADADLMLSWQRVNQPETPRVDELVPGFGQTEPSSEVFEFRPNRREFYHARVRYTPSWRWLDRVEAHLARQDITDDRRTRDFGSTVTVDESNESQLTGLTLELGSPLSEHLYLTWGTELYWDDVSSSRRRQDSDTGVTEPAPGRFPDGSSMDSVAGYFYGEWHPSSDFTLGGGLRYSRFDIDLPRADGPDAHLEPDDISGDAHLSWALRDGLRLVANAGRGFRAPNIFDLGTLGARPGNRFNVGNEDLDAETVWSYDLGFKAAIGRWQGEMFVFYADYDDKITSVATGDVTDEGRIVVRSENVNRVELYGIEAGARYAVDERIELYGLLNWVRGEEDGDDRTEPADRVPPVNGRLGVVFEPDAQLRLESFLMFAGEQDRLSDRDEEDPRIDPNGTAGWVTLNLNADWSPRPDLSLGLRLENLLDQKYREHGSGIDARGRSVGLWLRAGLGD